jgi:hypothetical protein
VTLETLDHPQLLSPTGRGNGTPVPNTRQLQAQTEENFLFPNEMSEGTTPSVDVILEETERILADYVGLSH